MPQMPHSAAYLHSLNRIALSRPGALALFTGIYRCSVCLQETPSVQGIALPDEIEHKHRKGIDTMWRLVVSHDVGPPSSEEIAGPPEFAAAAALLPA